MRLYLLGTWHGSNLYSARERAALAWAESLTNIAMTTAGRSISPPSDQTPLIGQRRVRHTAAVQHARVEGATHRASMLMFLNVGARMPVPYMLAEVSTLRLLGRLGMPHYDPELIQVMRNALDKVMTRVPTEYSTVEVKARLAEFILQAAAHGQTNYDALVSAATDQITAILALLT